MAPLVDAAHPYRHGDGSPRLRKSWVLYLDGLGTKERAKTVTDIDLQKRLAPEGWYHRFLYHGNQATLRRALYFTDNVVVGCPADGKDRDALVALNELTWGACTYVVGMALQAGIAFRGALTFGPAYIDDLVLEDDLASVRAAHGFGLVEAVQLEEEVAIFPRIVVGPTAVAEVQRLTETSEILPGPAPASEDWLSDENGVVFLNHLGSELVFDPNLNLSEAGLSLTQVVDGYETFIHNGLTSKTPGVRRKYEWLAGYYNRVVGATGLGAPIPGFTAALLRGVRPLGV